jgi:hypothetical protein
MQVFGQTMEAAGISIEILSAPTVMETGSIELVRMAVYQEAIHMMRQAVALLQIVLKTVSW